MDHPDDTRPGTHPVLACAAAIEASLKSVGDVNPAFMTTTEKRAALLELTDLGSQLESLRLRVIAACDDVAEEDGDPNVASWLGPRTRTGAGANHQAEKLATSLDTTWSVVATALASGAVNLEQAKVIVAALDRLLASAEVPEVVLAAAEAHLVDLAAKHSPHDLRILGRKILSIVAPRLCEDEERKRVEEEERRAHAKSRLWFTNNGEGTVELRATMSEAAAARLKTVLNSLTSPRHQSTPGGGAAPLTDPATGKKVPFDQRRGLAFEAFLEGLDPELEQGRAKRLFTGPQILAMGIRDKTCRAHGCLVPAKWCEAHHFTKSWLHGGTTDTKDGKLLCPWHHHRAHDDTYDMTLMANGDVRFRTRT